MSSRLAGVLCLLTPARMWCLSTLATLLSVFAGLLVLRGVSAPAPMARLGLFMGFGSALYGSWSALDGFRNVVGWVRALDSGAHALTVHSGARRRARVEFCLV